MFSRFTFRKILACILGGGILAFGLYQVHSFAGVTEGGALGLSLLLDHWFGISPAGSGLVMNVACYALGWKILGRDFIGYSAVCGGAFSIAYGICQQFSPLWPQLYRYPLAAAVLGAVFVGVGVGLCVRAGGAPSADDALAMSLSRLTGLGIQWVYLISDLTVLALSLTYIPWKRLIWSLLTVVLSGQIIGLFPEKNETNASGRR